MARHAFELILAVAILLASVLPLEVLFDAVAQGQTAPVPCSIHFDVPAVVAISERVACQQDVRLEKYKVEDVSFHFERKEWVVSFDERPPALSFDGCFRVTVNDETGEGEFQACP